MKMSLTVLAVLTAGIVLGDAVRFSDDGALRIDGDKYAMNWILKDDGSQYQFLAPGDATWASVKDAGDLEVVKWRRERADEMDLCEGITFSNALDRVVSLKGVKICFPFNDNYPDSKECVTRRCHAHLWPFGSAAWVCCLRMGMESPHLGWMLTKGELNGYEVAKRGRDCGSSNFRGVFWFRLADRTLQPGQTYELEWRLFTHEGRDDFVRQLEKRGSFIPKREHYVVEDAANPGERIERVEKNGKWTRVETLAVSNFKSFIERRLDFILDHQQYDAPGEIRDGAFLPYDNETDEQFKDWEAKKHRYDFDEGRERIGMGIAIAEAVRDHGYSNPNALPALKKYAHFIRTALQDEDFRTKSEVLRWKHNRIYNYAWVARFYFDMYDITGDGKYIDWAFGTAKAAFRFGGHNFYLIDMPARQSIETLNKVGRAADAEELLADYRKVAANYMKNGLLVPKSEVNYEQSIIAPAADFLVEMYLATKEQQYLDAALAMLPAVEAFNGMQSSWHLNDVAIRHWDGYWFGKRELFGDTFPHYWSAITADYFGNLAEATGNQAYARRASEICKANLGLFTEEGRGGAAYMYPNAVNGMQGRYLDPMSNDQDFALVFASRWLEEWPKAKSQK